MAHFLIRFKQGVLILASFFMLFCTKESEALIWQNPPEPFSPDGFALSSDLGVSRLGNAVAIWSDNDSAGLFASYFLDDAWGPHALLSSAIIEFSSVAVDNTGTSLAIWHEPFNNVIRTAHYIGGVWTNPLPDPLDTLTPDLNACPTAISMNGNGGGIAVWIDFVVFQVRSSTFSSGSWSAPTTIGIGATGLSVDYSSNGTAVAQWFDSGDVFVCNYIGGVWSAPIIIGNGNFTFKGNVGIDGSGRAVSSWIDSAGDVSVGYFNGVTWSSPFIVSTTPLNYEASFAMAPNGRGILTWVDASNVGYSSSFNGVSWGTPLLFAPNIPPFTGRDLISVAIISSAKSLVQWIDTGGNIRSASLPYGGSAWSDYSLISSGYNEGLYDLNAGYVDSGRGFSLWRNIFNTEGAQVFGSFSDIPLEGSSCIDPNTQLIVHILSFSASADPLIVAYNIRRNGVLIGVILTSDPLVFFDTNRNRGVVDYYSVVGVNAQGAEIGAPLFVNLQ